MTEGHTGRLEAALDGKYRIERKLGEGGMATVYLAEDIKHKRKVALKILRPELAAVIGAERFLAEIQTTANLQHPHILALFDSGEAEGYLYYVMPFIDGETLREKLDREKQLGVDEAVRIAKDVADALDYAHRNEVIHRDIKPANILLHDGRPVVADFGIALAVSAAGGGRMTETGLSLGTPHYMSPEQASADRDLSARSDVYSLGCVLYEMIAGQPPHTGPSAQSILVHILTKEATPLTELRHTVPPHVAATVDKAIEKLPADRFETARAFIEALGDERYTYRARPEDTTAAMTQGVATASVAPPRPWHRDARSVAGIGMVIVLAVIAGWGWLRPATPSASGPLRLNLDLGDIEPDRFSDVVVAPDASAFAFASVTGIDAAIYVRRAGEADFRRLPGTEGGRYPAFSPDGVWIVYRTYTGTGASDALMRVSLEGGAPLTVLPAGIVVNPGFPHWGDDGSIVFRSSEGPFRIAETGGQEPTLLIEGAAWAQFPRMLPGGRGVLLTDSRTSSIAVFDLEADTLRELIPSGIDATYVDTGHIIYANPDGGLFARPFALNTLEVSGSDVPVLDDVSLPQMAARGTPRASYSVSRNGTLVYGRGGAGASGTGQRLVVVDLEGNETPVVFPPRVIGEVAWSRDGRMVVYSSTDEGDPDPDIYTFDVELGTAPRRLTFEGSNSRPVFSPDGARVVFSSTREGSQDRDLFVKALDDNAPASSLISLEGLEYPTHWPSDDVIVFEQGPNPSELWLLDVSNLDDPRAQQYLSLEADLDDVVVSRDGTLAAYVSDESGRDEVYVRSFPEPGGRTAISNGGGGYPQWSPDGNTVFYWAQAAGGQSAFVGVSISRDPTVVLSTDTLFTGLYQGPLADLHPEGDRVIVPQPADLSPGVITGPDFIVVTNWFTELRERMGSN